MEGLGETFSDFIFLSFSKDENNSDFKMKFLCFFLFFLCFLIFSSLLLNCSSLLNTEFESNE